MNTQTSRSTDKKAFSLIETLMYVALLGIVMTFIVTVFRQMVWRDKLADFTEENVRIKAVSDKVNETLSNAAAIIRPAAGRVSDILVVRRTDGSFEKLAVRSAGGKRRFCVRRADSIEKLEIDSTEEREANAISQHITLFYIARPLYDHLFYRLESARANLTPAVTARMLRVPGHPVRDFAGNGAAYRGNFEYGGNIVSVLPKFADEYSKTRKAFGEALISESGVEKFLSDFDKHSKSSNYLKSRGKLKEFISPRASNDLGKVIFFTAKLVDMCSNEIALSAPAQRLAFETGTAGSSPEEIFGREIVAEYEGIMRQIARGGNKFHLRPDCGTLVMGVKQVCEANKTALIADLGIAAPFTGNITDDHGATVSIINLHYGKTVPLALNDVALYSDIEYCPPVSSPETRFDTIYEIIESKLPGLSNDRTLAQNLEVLYYGAKNIKKVTAYGGKIDIFDYKVRFPIRVGLRGREFDLAYFVRIAQDLASPELPDLSKGTPLPNTVKE